jgi:murein DD-endopeptidase MepM/ murein hydrolase activator NlpD
MRNCVDTAAAFGTPIYAPAAGVVLDAGPANGFGLAVYIQHPDGTTTLYGHINQYLVSAGQQIAEVGNRGQSTGPHLHIETHQGSTGTVSIPPHGWAQAESRSAAVAADTAARR